MYPTDGDKIDWMYGAPAHLLLHLRAVSARRPARAGALPARRGHRAADARATATPCSTCMGKADCPYARPRRRRRHAELRSLLRRPRDRPRLARGPRRDRRRDAGDAGSAATPAAAACSWGAPCPGRGGAGHRAGARSRTWTAGGRRVRSPLCALPDGRRRHAAPALLGGPLAPTPGADDGLRIHLVDADGASRWPRCWTSPATASAREPAWRGLSARAARRPAAGSAWPSSWWPSTPAPRRHRGGRRSTRCASRATERRRGFERPGSGTRGPSPPSRTATDTLAGTLARAGRCPRRLPAASGPATMSRARPVVWCWARHPSGRRCAGPTQRRRACAGSPPHPWR